MQFIKKNYMFLVVLLVALSASVYTVILIMAKNSEVNACISRRDQAVSQISAAYEQTKPSVNAKNMLLIQQDMQILETKTRAIQYVFGQFFRKAFQKFALEIEKNMPVPADPKGKKEKIELTLQSAEAILLNDFAKYYKSAPAEKKPLENSTENDKKAVEEFFMSYMIRPEGAKTEDGKQAPKLTNEETLRKTAFVNALDQFTADIKDTAIGKVDSSTVYTYLLFAMNVPATADIAAYKDLLNDVNSQFFVSRLIPGLEEENRVSEYTFSPTGHIDQIRIPSYLLQLQIRKDIFTRLKQGGVQKMGDGKATGFRNTTPPEGESVGNFKKHVYNLDFISEYSAVSKLFYEFGPAALKNNIVYYINNISIARLDAENIATLMKAAATGNELQVTAPTTEQQGPSRNRHTEGTLNFTELSKPVIGQSMLVKVQLEISCIIYTGGNLQRIQSTK